jgi:excisionase family DNA binding protein
LELLTVQDTARLLKVSTTTVRRFIADGKLAAVRVGSGAKPRGASRGCSSAWELLCLRIGAGTRRWSWESKVITRKMALAHEGDQRGSCLRAFG